MTMKLANPTPSVTNEGLTNVERALQSNHVCAFGGDTARLTIKPFAGGDHIRLQCLACGEGIGNALKKADHPDRANYPTWDQELQDRTEKYFRKKAEDDFERRRQRYRDDFLYTPEWKTMRQRVLERAGNRCESCLVASPTDVHHETYLHGLMPPAWLLRAVCRPCHDRLHETIPEEPPETDEEIEFE